MRAALLLVGALLLTGCCSDPRVNTVVNLGGTVNVFEVTTYTAADRDSTVTKSTDTREENPSSTSIPVKISP